jgi:hypothetical protein
MIKLDVTVPSGYKATGEYRRLTYGDFYYDNLYSCAGKWTESDSSAKKYIVLQREIKQEKELIGCLCGVSNYSLVNAESKSETFFQVEVIVDYRGEYITQSNNRWRYAYPVSEETYLRYLAALKKDKD